MSQGKMPTTPADGGSGFGVNGGTALVATGAILILVIGIRSIEYIVTRADDPTLNAAVGAALAAFTAAAAAWGYGKIKNNGSGTGNS